MRNIPSANRRDNRLSIDIQIQRLVATLLKMNLQKYLITKDFTYLGMETSTHRIWEYFEDQVRSESNVAMLIPGYTGYAEKALPRFVQCLYNEEKKFLPYFLTELIERSKKYINKSYFEELAQRCEDLGYSSKISRSKIIIQNKNQEEKEDKEKIDKNLIEELDEITTAISKIFFIHSCQKT